MCRRIRSADSMCRDGKKNLWMVNHYAVTPEMPDNTRHYELAELLARKGWITTIFASPFSHKQKSFMRSVSPRKPVHAANESGVRFIWLYSLPYYRNNWRRYANMMSFLLVTVGAGLFLRPKPHIIVGSSPHLLSALGAWILARWYRVPFVFEVRDLWPDTLIDMGLSIRAIIQPLVLIERVLYAEADHIIALTEGIKTSIASKQVSASKITFVPNAARHAQPIQRDARDSVRRRLGWENKVVFIYAGAHAQANALDQVIRAIRLAQVNDDALFVFLGDGHAKLDLVRQAKGMTNVAFMDPIAKNEVHPVLNAADVGIISLGKSKIFEGARPNKLFDYVAADLPILLTLPGEAQKLVEDTNCGIFSPPDDPQALARRFEWIMAHPDKLDAMRGNVKILRGKTRSREDTADLVSGILDLVNRKCF